MAGADTLDQFVTTPGQPASVPNAPSSVPTPSMPFLGREDDLARVLALLDEPNVRLLTLTGPGGVGKTRLALEVARRVESDFADGIRYVPLVAVREPSLVLPEIARLLDVRTRPGRSPLAEVIDVVRERHLLVVLDNFEHLLGEIPRWLPAVLEAAPRIKALVSSRTPLNLTPEQRYVVLPFPVPQESTPEQLSASAGVNLFAQRARMVNPDFQLDRSNIGAVGEVCRRLDGLALAIELAAARTAIFSPAQVLDLLSDRMALLNGGQRDAPARHQSIRNAIGWSYDLLSDEARDALCRLSVFTGGASLDAIARVTMPDGGNDVSRAVAIVTELAEHSLIHPMPGAMGEPRYTMLETIREFGLERLRSLFGERAARDAHAAWCAYFARESFAEPWTQLTQVAWLDRLDREQPNLRAAIDWLIDEDRAEDAIDVASDLCWFWAVRGYESDKASVFSRLENHPRLTEPTVHRAMLLGRLGSVAFMRGQQGRAERLLLEAIELFREHGNLAAELEAQCQLGLILRSLGALDRSSAALERSLAISIDLGDSRMIASGHGNLGLNALLAGDTEAGKASLEEAVRVGETAGDAWISALFSMYLGHLAAEDGDDVTAERLLTSSQDTFRAMGNTLDQPKVSLYLAELAERRGTWQDARRYLEEGLEAAQITMETDFIARTHLGLGAVSLQCGDRAGAAIHLLDALRHYQELGSGYGTSTSIELLASLAVEADDVGQATRLLAAADGLERTGTTTWLIGPPELEGVDARYRFARTLGERAFTEEWDAGRELEPNAAIAEAEALGRRILNEHERARSLEVGEQSGLTSREVEVLRYLADGLGNQEIADAMFVSRRTIASHVEHILTKLDLRSRTAAVAYAIRNGLA
jgi:predicted ATPase/DNA-binding CsgD family transcriptional regulator